MGIYRPPGIFIWHTVVCVNKYLFDSFLPSTTESINDAWPLTFSDERCLLLSYVRVALVSLHEGCSASLVCVFMVESELLMCILWIYVNLNEQLH